MNYEFKTLSETSIFRFDEPKVSVRISKSPKEIELRSVSVFSIYYKSIYCQEGKVGEPNVCYVEMGRNFTNNELETLGEFSRICSFEPQIIK
jgi:hypothetical protein